MKNELIKQFAKTMIRRTFILVLIMVVVTAVSQSIAPIVDNSMALTQMENNDLMFVAMSTYNRIKPIFNALYSCIILWFVYTLGRDTYKFNKSINNIENEKEN